jgi:acetolactate decarboxylase
MNRTMWRWGGALWWGFAGALAAAESDDFLFQYAPFAVLAGGGFAGDYRVGDLLQHGDFGLGTLNGIAGELIVLDGQSFQGRADGLVVEVAADREIPFAEVKHFVAERHATLPAGLSLEQLKARLDAWLGDPQAIYAIRIDGDFQRAVWRSVPEQSPPYPTLEETLKHQVIFEGQNLQGTLVGFRLPSNAPNLYPGGYHFHFLSADHRQAGHLLDLLTADGNLYVDIAQGLALRLPAHGGAVPPAATAPADGTASAYGGNP